jgi:lipoate-protein ligase A
VRQRPDLPDALPPAPAAIWFDVELPSVEENLAVDEALLEQAHEGLTTETWVRTWMAAEPTVVLGSSSRMDEEIDMVRCDAAGARVVRRPSGGATVVLGPGCLMWSVITPHPIATPSIEAIHAAMLEPLANALSGALLRATSPAGLRVVRRGTSDLAIVESGTGAVDYGLHTAAGERKISGNALRVRRHGVLYHGTLLDSFDLALVGSVLRHPPREPDYRSQRSHGDFLANLKLGRDVLEGVVRGAFNATLACRDWPRDRVATLVSERYSARDWTCRL